MRNYRISLEYIYAFLWNPQTRNFGSIACLNQESSSRRIGSYFILMSCVRCSLARISDVHFQRSFSWRSQMSDYHWLSEMCIKHPRFWTLLRADPWICNSDWFEQSLLHKMSPIGNWYIAYVQCMLCLGILVLFVYWFVSSCVLDLTQNR
jgi:hypothetical protein